MAFRLRAAFHGEFVWPFVEVEDLIVRTKNKSYRMSTALSQAIKFNTKGFYKVDCVWTELGQNFY
jgi:hypothetical protein